MTKLKNKTADLVGLVPAGGRARRLAPMTISKEILPVRSLENADDSPEPKPVACYLLESFRQAGIKSTYVVLAPGKWDIPETLGSGSALGLNLAYLVRALPYGVPFTVDEAHPFLGAARIAFGFPDILFTPVDAVARLVARQDETGADVVLGLFPVDHPRKWDAIELDDLDRISRLEPKPHDLDSGLTWILAVWTPEFSLYLHRWVNEKVREIEGSDSEDAHLDLSLGVVMRSALLDGLQFDQVTFADGRCLDVGTPEDLETARRLRSDPPSRSID